MDTLRITKAKKLTGEVTVPGDKSISHRAVMCGALASGDVSITNLCSGDDTARTVTMFQQMGISIQAQGHHSFVIHGKGLHGLREPDDLLYAGNSGTTLRLMAGLLSAQPFFSVLSGDSSLRRRPMNRVVEPLRHMGAHINGRDHGNFAPLAIQGGPLRGIAYHLPVASAQVKSALLFAGLYADSQTTVIEPVLSRDHTERMLSCMGVPINIRGSEVTVQPCEHLEPCRLDIPGDISAAAFFIVAGLIVPDAELVLRAIGINPTRTGCIDILRAMGGQIDIFNERIQCGEPVADIAVRSSSLVATTIEGDLIPRAIDELPIIAVAAAMAAGTTVIRNARELRVKESDRIAAMTSELKKCGVVVEAYDDGMAITGGRGIRGTVCDSFGDHRVAMSLAIAGLCAEEEMIIRDCSCIQTSFPEFMGTLVRIKG
ncbi:MAG: 3-phosphoshikimate 1-carboxyvinyltransferase [Desulfobacterota bacterium]|nr:3-phosphoshikimate 1-carboxyvinyltransferase [Thermodesulfobacteriota bacterium]